MLWFLQCLLYCRGVFFLISGACPIWNRHGRRFLLGRSLLHRRQNCPDELSCEEVLNFLRILVFLAENITVGMWEVHGKSRKGQWPGFVEMSFKKRGEGEDFNGNMEHLLKNWVLLRATEWLWLRSNKSLTFLETSRPFNVSDWLNFDHCV